MHKPIFQQKSIGAEVVGAEVSKIRRGGGGLWLWRFRIFLYSDIKGEHLTKLNIGMAGPYLYLNPRSQPDALQKSKSHGGLSGRKCHIFTISGREAIFLLFILHPWAHNIQ